MTSFPVAHTPLKSGMIIAGKYRLLRPIGAGGMGEVWAAKNELLAREVALKLIRRRDDDLRRRLQREARACGPLQHRNVIDVYDVVETEDGEPVLVMQLLSGETLAELLARRRRLDPPLAALIGREIASALAAVHELGVVHRDLKPANIFLHRDAEGESPVVKVLDFGISKNVVRADSFHTVAGGAVGSTNYMSPEQVLVSPDVDHRADIWALGVVLFEMLTGRRPFQGEISSVVMQIIRGEIPRVSWLVRHVDPAFVETVARCMCRERELRLGPAAEVARRLTAFAQSEDPWGIASAAASRAGALTTSTSAASSAALTVRRSPPLCSDEAGRTRADDDVTTRRMERPAAASMRELAPPSYGAAVSLADLAAGALAFYRSEPPAQGAAGALPPPSTRVMGVTRPEVAGAPPCDRGATSAELPSPPGVGDEITLVPRRTTALLGGEAAAFGASSQHPPHVPSRRGDPCAASVSAGVTVDAVPALDEPRYPHAERPEGRRHTLALVISAAISAVYLSGGLFLAALVDGSQPPAAARALSHQTGLELAPRSEHAVSPSSPALPGAPASDGRDPRCEILNAAGPQGASVTGAHGPSATGAPEPSATGAHGPNATDAHGSSATGPHGSSATGPHGPNATGPQAHVISGKPVSVPRRRPVAVSSGAPAIGRGDGASIRPMKATSCDSLRFLEKRRCLKKESSSP